MSYRKGELLGMVAYEAYCQRAGYRSFTGDSLPEWEMLDRDIQDCWIAAAEAIREEIL